MPPDETLAHPLVPDADSTAWFEEQVWPLVEPAFRLALAIWATGTRLRMRSRKPA